MKDDKGRSELFGKYVCCYQHAAISFLEGLTLYDMLYDMLSLLLSFACIVGSDICFFWQLQ